MDYLTDTNDCLVHTSFVCKDFNGLNAKFIAEQLEDLSPYIQRKHKSSRAMWPDEELVGVEFNREDPMLKGSVRADQIKIKLDHFKQFDSVYDELENWFSNTDLKLPPKNEFKVESFTFHSKDDGTSLEPDYTKCANPDDVMGYVYKSNGIQSNYSTIQGMVSFLLTEPEEIPISTFKSYVDSILEDKIIIIGDTEDIIDEQGD